MFKKFLGRRASSIVEYTALVVLIIVAMVIFYKYILRGIGGYWKNAGDSCGFGRQYDPKKTLECIYDPVYTNQWYDSKLFDTCAPTLNQQQCIQGSLGTCN